MPVIQIILSWHPVSTEFLLPSHVALQERLIVPFGGGGGGGQGNLNCLNLLV